MRILLVAAALIDSSCQGFHATAFQQTLFLRSSRDIQWREMHHRSLNRLRMVGDDEYVDEEDVLRRVVEQEYSDEKIKVPIADISGMKHKYTIDDWDGRGPIERGDMNGLDDPRNVSWRLKAEDLIRKAGSSLDGITVYDITWNIGDLTVTIEKPSDEFGVSLDDIIDTTEAIKEILEPYEEELRILSRHTLEVSSRGVEDVLTAERDFITFKGFEVAVETISTFSDKRAPILGRLHQRDVHETVINQKGRMVKIPNFYIEEVRLVKSKEE